MRQQFLFGAPPPAYKETSAEAWRRLHESGRDLKVKERVRLAIAYLQPTTREALYELFSENPFGTGVKITTVSSAVNSLIWDGLVRVVGRQPGKHGSSVEILQLGVDERVKKRKGRLLEQPYLAGLQPAWRLRWDWPSFVIGLLGGGAIAVAAVLFILIGVSLFGLR